MSRLRRRLKRASGTRQTWDEMYEELHDYHTVHGDCNVIINSGKLGKWVSHQRGRKKRGELSQDQIRNLDRIGFEWVLREFEGPAEPWIEMFRRLQAYQEVHGDCNVVTSTSKLGRWVAIQRRRKKERRLKPDQIRNLNSIGFEWVLAEHEGPVEPWIEMFRQLQVYQEKHGDCNVPTLTTKLGRWVSTQRLRKKGPTSGHQELSEGEISKLESIGFVWSIVEQSPHETWDEMFERLQQYYSRTGQTWLQKPTTDQEKKLSSWIKRQRSRRRDGDLSESQIQQLDSLGFDWNLEYTTHTWEEMFAELQRFFQINGHCRVPTNSSKLGSWVSLQRMLRRRFIKGKRQITPEQISRLDSIGFVWEAADYDGRWQEMYQALVEYYEEHGHTRVPIRSGKLGKWVQLQRMCKTKKSGSHRQLTFEQIEQLDKINFVWKADENIETWEAMYEKLRLYKEEHGDCLVTKKIQRKLGTWVETQRQRRKRQVTRQKILTPRQVRMLDDLGFAWTKEESEMQKWEQNFCRVQAYYEEHGHSNIPRRKHDHTALRSLSRWGERMRGICKGTLRGQTALTDEQIKRLKSIGIGTEKKGLPRATESPSLDSPIMNVSETVSQEITVKKEFARSSYAPTRSNATNLNGAWSWLVLPDGRPSIDNGAATQKSANENKRKQREDTTAANKTAATAKRRWDWIRNLDGSVVTVSSISRVKKRPRCKK